MQFAAQTIAAIDNSGQKPWLLQFFFGVFGSNGPLPIHLTEYAIEQAKYHDDPIFARFVNLFHHRMLGLFYRNWRLARPIADFPVSISSGKASFATKLQHLAGIPESSSVEQAFVGLLSTGARTKESLVQVLAHFSGAPVQVFSLVPSWLQKDEDQRSQLGRQMSQLGRDLQLGKAVLSVHSRIHIEIGPLTTNAYAELLPDAPRGEAMNTLVHKMLGSSLSSSVQLVANRGMALPIGQMRLGYSSWLGLENTQIRRGCTSYPGRLMTGK